MDGGMDGWREGGEEEGGGGGKGERERSEGGVCVNVRGSELRERERIENVAVRGREWCDGTDLND